VNDRDVIDQVHVVDVAQGLIDEQQSVSLQDGRIHEVLPSDPRISGNRIHGAGRYLCPGLIDGHAHFFLAASNNPRGHFLEADDAARMNVARHNAQTALAAGITTIRDCGAPAPLMWELQREVEAGETAAPHILSCGSPLMRIGGHCHFFGGEVASVQQVQQAVARQLESGAGFVKLMASGGGLTPGTNPGEADLPIELMRAAADAAHEHGVHVTAHCHATDSITRAIEAGLDMIEHASFVESDGRYRYNELIAKSIRDRDIVVGPTVISALRTANRLRESSTSHNPQDVWAVERLEGRLTNIGHFYRLGMKILGGTDCGVTDTPFDSLVDELIAYTRAGLSNIEALRTATCDSGRYLRLGPVGEVKPGYRADLILLANNPLQDLNALRKPLIVVKEGRVVYNSDQSSENHLR